MNEDIKSLIEQRKELDRRIRELTNQQTTVGNARIGMEHYPTNLPDRWYLAINVQYLNRDDLKRRGFSFRSVVNGMNRKDVVNAIPGIISDLQELYEKDTGT